MKLARGISYIFGLHLAGSQILGLCESHHSPEWPISSLIVCRREIHLCLTKSVIRHKCILCCFYCCLFYCCYFVFSATHSQKKKSCYTFDYLDWKIKDQSRCTNIGKITKGLPSLLNKGSSEKHCNMERRKKPSHRGCYLTLQCVALAPAND